LTSVYFSIYFQGSLKTVASGHKCGKTLSIKTDFCCLLGELKKKKRICDRMFRFQKTVLPFVHFSQEERNRDEF
jgi:hypothetical protein